MWEKELKTIADEQEKSKNKDDGKKSFSKKPKEPSLLRILVKCFGFKFTMHGIIMAIMQILLG